MISIFLVDMVILLSLIRTAVCRGPQLDLQERMFIPDGTVDSRCHVAQVGRRKDARARLPQATAPACPLASTVSELDLQERMLFPTELFIEVARGPSGDLMKKCVTGAEVLRCRDLLIEFAEDVLGRIGNQRREFAARFSISWR
jgi:hypothetical protein